jgi:hypothetical protein
VLGPPNGRYLLRSPGDPPDAPPTHVLVIATLGAPERRLLTTVRRSKANAQPEPEPAPVATGRATIIDVGEQLADATAARTWLAGAGEERLAADLEILNRALHAFRLISADPYQNIVTRGQALVARIGYGAGEQVADGLWTDARELVLVPGRRRRATALAPQARLAAVLNGRERTLTCEELVLRARLDLDQGRSRESALQVMIALDAALAELPGEPAGPALGSRLDDLRGRRDGVTAAAQAALAGPLPDEPLEVVTVALGRIEAALRARRATGAGA